MASWAIATTCRDLPEVVQAFVAHHVEAGASEIHLFFDDPEDPAFEMVAPLPQVRAVRCDAAHWAARGGGRPEDHRRRQSHNANQARKSSRADWIGHIDIDEFVSSVMGFGAYLDTVPEESETLRLLPAEKIFTVVPADDGPELAGPFKRPFERRGGLERAIWGARGAVLKQGFLGHVLGKTFVRRGSRGRFAIHQFKRDGAGVGGVVEGAAAQLLHFFPFGYAAWREKFTRRLSMPGYLDDLPPEEQARYRLLEEADSAGEDAARALFADLCVFGPERLEMLERAGCLLDPAIDLHGAVARVFGTPEQARAGSTGGAI